jgi:chromosome segregation ATPase
MCCAVLNATNKKTDLPRHSSGEISNVSSPSSNQPLAAPLRLVAETAALFREECTALDHLVDELYRDVERLRDELVRKSDELGISRHELAERSRQLSEERTESAKLIQLAQQQDTRLSEALGEIKSLREQSAKERTEAHERETARFALLEQKLRAAEADREQLQHQLHLLQASAAAAGASGGGSGDSLGPLMNELGDLRRQLSETQAQLSDARTQLTDAIQKSAAPAAQSLDQLTAVLTELTEMRRQLGEAQTQIKEAPMQLAHEMQRNVSVTMPGVDPLPQLLAELSEMRKTLADANSHVCQTQQELSNTRSELAEAIQKATSAMSSASPVVVHHEGAAAASDAPRRLAILERERNELESELELVRARATELQEVVNQQRRELAEQKTEITNELRQLREMAAQWPHATEAYSPHEEHDLVAATTSGESMGAVPDPVVTSVMAQFARLQKDVAQRRKKK